MNILQKITVSAVVVGTGFLAGCNSSSSSAPAFTPYARVAPLAAQTATISIADPAGTPVVTITQPADMTLAVTATPVSATNVTLSVTATNNAPRLLFGGKIVVNTISDDTTGSANPPTSSATGTTNDTSETFATLGFKAIPTGGSATTVDDISVTDLDGLANPLVLTVTIPTQDHMAYGGNSSTGDQKYMIEDINGGLSLVDQEIASYSNYTPGYSGLVDGISSPDGRYVYYANRNSLYVFVLDTVTLKTTGIKVSDGTVGNVGGIAMTSDGHYLYAGYTTGVHRYCYAYGTDTKAYVAKIDLTDNSVVGTATIKQFTASNYYATSIKDISLSGDGNTLAVTSWTACSGRAGAQVFTMSTTVDSDGTMAVSDNVWPAVGPRYLALNQDGSTLYYVSNDDASLIHAIDVASGDQSSVSVPSGSSPVYFRYGPDGRLYYLHRTSTNALDIMDTAGAITTINMPSTSYGMSFDRDGGKYYVDTSSGTTTWDITNDTMSLGAAGAGNVAKHSYVTSSY